MSTGTGGKYWDDKALPSVFKHELLRCYIPPFGAMTSSRTDGKRVVYLDGYAGEGRYASGEPGSAEIALRVAAHHLEKAGLNWSCFFSEQQGKSFDLLEKVVAEYRAEGVDARAHRGDVDGILDQVTTEAAGLPLFLFLDPCGLCLPFDRLIDVLARKRQGKWPPTELLMNFSMMAVWRLGGHVKSPRGNEKSLRRFDDVCGGPWWREYFLDPAVKEPEQEVATEYGRRLNEATGMNVLSVPVRKAPHHKPVYELVFATRSQHGLWAVGDAIARAHAKWWETVELQNGEDDSGALFSTASVLRPDPKKVEAEAVPAMADNLERLLQRTKAPVKLVEHTLAVFGDYYGMVTESVARKAVKHLHKAGGTPSTGVGERTPRNLVVEPPAAS